MQIEKIKPSVAWAAFCLYHLFVIYVTVLPASRLRSVHVGDKYLHFAEFFILGILSFWAFRQRQQRILRNLLFFKWLFWGLFMAVLTECLQLIAPGRFSDIQDVVANTLGYLLAAAIIYMWDKFILKTSYRPAEG